MKKILLLDGNNLGWMSFGMASLSYQGQRTEVISIGLSMIRNYIHQFEPDRCIVVWDGGKDAERLALYPEYKKKKELTKAEKKERDWFFIQVNELIDILSKLGIEQYKLVNPKREADDVIYGLIECKKNEENMFVVVSSDRDFFQLFADPLCQVTIYSPIKKELINKETAEEMFLISMSYYLEYRAMVGDLSDNLPGVKGLGPVKAIWLVNNVLDEDLAVRDTFTPRERRVIDLLSANYEQFDLMKKLIKFKLIGQDELNRGRLLNEIESVSQIQEAMMEICERYGLARIEENFVSFLQPFEMLWRRKNE